MRLSVCFALIVLASVSLSSTAARAECSCVSVAGEVAASVQADVMKADNLYARGDWSGALAIYAKAYATSKDAALLYAQAMANWQLGASAQAKANFEAYLKAGGNLVYKDRAEAGLKGLGAGLTAGAAMGAHAVGDVGGGAKGVLGAGGALGVGATSAVAGGVEGGVGAGAGTVGGISSDVKPKKPGKTVGIVLGVVAIAAIGAVGIHSIAAGVSDNISLDPKFDLGLGVAGVAVGISAIYVAGITTAAAGAGAGGACGVATLPAHKPIVAPYATAGGGGLTAALSF